MIDRREDNLTEEEFISFMKSGNFCKEFGCQMERIGYYQNPEDTTAEFKCKYCKRQMFG